MPIEKLQVSSLSELVAKTLELACPLPQHSCLWFRGLPSETFNLLPRLLRDGRAAEEIFEREQRLLTRFRQRSLAYWPAGYPQDDWEHLFAMQHFGVPTRLLDWSENLFVATHFALESLQTTGTCLDAKPVVWCVDPVAWNRSVPRLKEFGDSIQVLTTADEDLEGYRPMTNRKRNKAPVAIYGAHNSGRIVAQRGTFMVWGENTQPLEKCAEEQSASLWCVRLEGDRESYSRDLRILGFNETMIFPELPALGSELSRIEGWKR